jgi:hypothetical protein
MLDSGVWAARRSATPGRAADEPNTDRPKHHSRERRAGDRGAAAHAASDGADRCASEGAAGEGERGSARALRRFAHAV